MFSSLKYDTFLIYQYILQEEKTITDIPNANSVAFLQAWRFDACKKRQIEPELALAKPSKYHQRGSSPRKVQIAGRDAHLEDYFIAGLDCIQPLIVHSPLASRKPKTVAMPLPAHATVPSKV
jgi:hypothetical protein